MISGSDEGSGRSGRFVVQQRGPDGFAAFLPAPLPPDPPLRYGPGFSVVLERAVELDPGHTGALLQLGHANDLAGNDDDAIGFYERALSYPPVHVCLLMNLGILYEDNERYDRAMDCYKKLVDANPQDEHARLFLRDSQASLTMHYSPEEEAVRSRFSQVLEIPVTDFELSVRSRNCLKKMNIRTLGDLTRVSEQQLLSSKNFGETSLQEIKEMMASKGLRLGQSLEEGTQYERRFPSQQPLSDQDQAVLAHIGDLEPGRRVGAGDAGEERLDLRETLRVPAQCAQRMIRARQQVLDCCRRHSGTMRISHI